jgi:ATP-dependent RNA helicase RhlE
VTQLDEQPQAQAPATPVRTFAELGLGPTTLAAVELAGYTEPTPIQARAIGPALEGRDVLGCARTGTGKTAAFVLPMLERLARSPGDRAPADRPGDRPSRDRAPSRRIRSLVLAPTRELAIQIAESIETYGKKSSFRHVVIYGGVSQMRQVEALRRGVDILVATPGRLCDLMSQGEVRLGDVEILVIDEFDRMLDDGFLPDIRRILSRVPAERQTLLFSATVPREIEPVLGEILDDPVRVAVHAQSSTPDLVEQAVRLVDQRDKRAALEELLVDDEVTRALVFTRTKHGANRVVKQLGQSGLSSEAIHGNKSQNARQRSLQRFRTGAVRVLVATDVAARGLDIDEVSHVINFDLPVDPESYVHRIGRTARAGKTGRAISLCTPEERGTLARIERLIARKIPRLEGDPSRATERRPADRDDRERRPVESRRDDRRSFDSRRDDREPRRSFDSRRDDREPRRSFESRRDDREPRRSFDSRRDDREPRRFERARDAGDHSLDRTADRTADRQTDRSPDSRRSDRRFSRGPEPREDDARARPPRRRRWSSNPSRR